MTLELPHILLIDKPAGMTSFDVIRQLRRQHKEATGEKAPKMGHAGTLDPAATGLLIIGFGEGTKQMEDFLKLDKEYLAEVELGTRTDSGDLDGHVLENRTVETIDEGAVELVIGDLVGDITLPVSAYSAIKQAGTPLYKKARAAAKRGEVVKELPTRTMAVHEAAYLGSRKEKEKIILTVRFAVGSGTYIRSLAEEIGRKLQLPATLKSLRRTQIGVFDVAHAKRPEEIGEIS